MTVPSTRTSHLTFAARTAHAQGDIMLPPTSHNVRGLQAAQEVGPRAAACTGPSLADAACSDGREGASQGEGSLVHINAFRDALS